MVGVTNRYHLTLLSLDKVIDTNNAVRAIDAFVDDIDLT